MITFSSSFTFPNTRLPKRRLAPWKSSLFLEGVFKHASVGGFVSEEDVTEILRQQQWRYRSKTKRRTHIDVLFAGQLRVYSCFSLCRRHSAKCQHCPLPHVLPSLVVTVTGHGHHSSQLVVNLFAPELFFFNFSTPCIQNVNNAGTKYVRITKQTAF